jgi:hypothetical protein
LLNDRPTDCTDELASKGRPSCPPHPAALVMAPPIKKENLPAMEDCRVLLKNVVDIKLKASANVKLAVGELFFTSCFLGPVCQSVRG